MLSWEVVVLLFLVACAIGVLGVRVTTSDGPASRAAVTFFGITLFHLAVAGNVDIDPVEWGQIRAWARRPVPQRDPAIWQPRAKTFLAPLLDVDIVDFLESTIVQLNPNVAWDDIANLQAAKRQLEEARLVRPWRGVLMVGPPGCGKTLLAEAVATEHSTTFFNISPLKLMSEGGNEPELLVQTLFEMARFYSPSTIFIDSIDRLCSGDGEDMEISRRLVSELRVQMDATHLSAEERGKLVQVLAATNKQMDIDAELLERFVLRISVPLPNEEEREALLRVSFRGLKVDSNVNFSEIASGLQGQSAKDIVDLCQVASMMTMCRAFNCSPKHLRNHLIFGQDLNCNCMHLVQYMNTRTLHLVQFMRMYKSAEEVDLSVARQDVVRALANRDLANITWTQYMEHIFWLQRNMAL